MLAGAFRSFQAEDQTSLVRAWPTPNAFDCFDLQQLETEFRVLSSTSMDDHGRYMA